eukprot:m.230663 g.230663  ORF g.230663 m.230663 type:complete len:218 (+) comp40060_c0_seq8:95-748(+)
MPRISSAPLVRSSAAGLLLLLVCVATTDQRSPYGSVIDQSKRAQLRNGKTNPKPVLTNKTKAEIGGCSSKRPSDRAADVASSATQESHFAVPTPPPWHHSKFRCRPQTYEKNVTDVKTGCHRRIKLKMCAGMCESFVDPIDYAASYCFCCRPSQTEERSITLRCPDSAKGGGEGTAALRKSVQIPTACKCQPCSPFEMTTNGTRQSNGQVQWDGRHH